MSVDAENEAEDNRTASPNLTEEQSETLQHLQEVVGGIDGVNAIQVLEECDWDLERAVNKFFGVANSPNNETSLRRRNLGSDANPPPVALVPPNQRIIRVAHSEYRGFWWALLWLFEPIRFTYHILFGVARFFTSFLWPDPRNQVTDPVGDVNRFIEHFRATYVIQKTDKTSVIDDNLDVPSSSVNGTEQYCLSTPTSAAPTLMPPFFAGSYAQALQEAKRNLRFLIVYLHGDSHEDTQTFCEHTLRNPEVLHFFHNSDQVILWGCNIKSPEGYRVSRTLRENTYPFIGVIGLTNLAPSESGQYSSSTVGMALLGRIEGAVKPIDLIQQLTSILDDHQGATIAARLERREREARTQILAEQDVAFQEALAQDRARTAVREEELRVAAREAAEKALSAQRERILQDAWDMRRAHWRACLPPAPLVGSPSTVQLSFKMPNGQRLSRVFSISDSIKILYYFVLSHDEAPKNFDIQANFPKRQLQCRPEPESDLEDYIPSPDRSDVSDQSVKSRDIVFDWTPKTPNDPPTFSQLGLCKPEILFVLDQDA